MTDLDPRLVMMNALIRERDAAEASVRDLRAFAEAKGLADADADAVATVGAERFLVYRQLVQNRMRNTVRDFIERTAARLGARTLFSDFSDFMHERAATSYYLRDVPAEFVAWVSPRWAARAETPDHLIDLANHELLEYDIRNDHRGGEAPTGEGLALDRPLRFDGAARLMRYDYAVHRLPASVHDRTEPERVPTRLLVYRDVDSRVRYLELTPLAYAALEQLIEHHQPLAQGLQAACASLGEPLDDARLATTAQLLADLAERGVLLGAEPAIPG